MMSPPTQPRACRVARRALLPAFVAAAFATPLQAADLMTITRDALSNNADLAAARADLRSIEANRDVAQADLLPQAGGSANVSHNRQYESQSTERSGTADLSGLDADDQPLAGFLLSELGGGAQAGDDSFNSVGVLLEATQALFDAVNAREVDQAERQIDQEVYLVAATEQQLLIDVAGAYFDILRADEILEARRAQERAIGRQLEQAREQFEVGLIAVTEVEEAQARFDQSRAERIAAESSLQVSFETLERLTGQRYQSIESLQEDFPIEPPSPRGRDEWVELAMDHNPLVLAQQAGVEVSRSVVEVARAGRLPVVEAFANYQYADSDSDGLAGYDSDSQVGLRLNVPLYTGGRTRATVRQTTFQLESSQYNFESQRREAIQQVRSLYTQVSNDVSTVEARAQAIVSNQSALDATRAGYEVGTRNIVDVLNAEQNLYSAIADYAQARYDYVINLLSLYQQAGVLDVEAIEEVNEWLDAESVSFTLPEEEGNDRFLEALDIGEPPRRPE